MSSGGAEPELAWQAALSQVATLAGRAGRRVVACGRLAARLSGLLCPVDTLDLIADGPPAGHLEAVELAGGGWTWSECEVPVRWIERDDHYKPLYLAAAEAAEHPPSSPVPVAPMGHVAAMLLAGRRPEDAGVITALMIGAHLDPEAARAAVRQWLGVYALDDLDALVQEAEWRLMRQRYAGGEEPH